MNLNREQIRAIIFYNFKRGLFRNECLQEMSHVRCCKPPDLTSSLEAQNLKKKTKLKLPLSGTRGFSK